MLLVLFTIGTALVGVTLYVTNAEADDPQAPRAQGPEDVRRSGGCECHVGGRIVTCGQPCGERIDMGCFYGQDICSDRNGVGECLRFTGFEPSTKVCREGAPCDPPDMCDGAGQCIENPKFECPAEEACTKYECSQNYTATSCVAVAKPKVHAGCDRSIDPFQCGELYWVRFTQTSPPQCGGDACPSNYQQQADPCGVITCTGSQHTREFGASNQEFSYVCRDATLVDVTSLMDTAGSFQNGPGVRASAGQTYDVPFRIVPTRRNFTVRTVPAKVTVIKKPVLCRVNNASRMYGRPNPRFTFSCGAFVDPDTTASMFGTRTPTTDAQTNSPVGSYPIRLSPPGSDNYAISVQEGTLRIDPIPLTCSTRDLSLTRGVAFSREFVEAGFSVLGGEAPLEGAWSFFDINGEPMSFDTRPWAPSTITVKGTFTPDSPNYTSVSCQLNVTVRQCTQATVAQDCTEDDGNACTDNACDETTGECYNKYRDPSVIGSLNTTVTLLCPNTTLVEFDDVLACVDPTDTTALYRVGIGTSPVSWNGSRGSLISMTNTVVNRAACRQGRCSFTTQQIVFERESPLGVPPRLPPPIHAGVAAFAGGRLLREGGDNERIQCPAGAPCDGKTCAEGTLNTTTCECETEVLCGNGKLDPGEQCDPNIPSQPLPPGCDASKQFICTPDCKWQANPDLCPYGCPNNPKCWFHSRHTNADGFTGHDIFAMQNTWDDPCCCPQRGVSPPTPHLRHCQESGEQPGAHPSFSGSADTPERFIPNGAGVYPEGALIGDYKQKYVPFEITNVCPYGGPFTCAVWNPSGGALVCDAQKATLVCGCIK
jgi:hypothetical protein